MHCAFTRRGRVVSKFPVGRGVGSTLRYFHAIPSGALCDELHSGGYADVALAACYQDLVAVLAGTTLGMLIADVPAVCIGDRLARKVPMRLVHSIAAAIIAIWECSRC